MKVSLLAASVILAACAEITSIDPVNRASIAYGAPATGYRDTDGDGVMDLSDVCPRSRPGISVDVLGCAKEEANTSTVPFFRARDCADAGSVSSSTGWCEDNQGCVTRR